MLFAKHKLRVFPHLIPQPLLLPWEVKGSYDFMGVEVFFAALRDSAFPSHGLRGPCYGDELRGHATGVWYGGVLRDCATSR